MAGEKTLSVAAIARGTVIDHIVAGQAINILRMLRLAQEKCPITVGLNLSSKKLQYKDLIKIENRILSQGEQDKIAIFAQNATLNIIENYAIIKKIVLPIPTEVINVLQCANLNCITKAEKVESRFEVIHVKKNPMLRCQYCEKIFERQRLKEYVE